MSAAQQVERLASSLRHHGVGAVDVTFVLGSGLGAFAERIERARAIPYAEIDGMPTSGVKGHAGRLVVGELGECACWRSRGACISTRVGA